MKRTEREQLGNRITLTVALYIGLSMVFMFAYTMGVYFLLRSGGAIRILEYSRESGQMALALQVSKLPLFLTVLIVWIISSVLMCFILHKRIRKAVSPVQSEIDEISTQLSDAQEANRSKNTFIANISHEIRTPMNAILGFSELLLQMDASDEVNNYANDIKRASKNLLAIINDLLDISKIESGKLELNPVNYFTHYLFTDVESVVSVPIMNKSLEWRTHINPELPSQLFGDIVRIRQILINVVNNAVKFTREGYVEFSADYEYAVDDTGKTLPDEIMMSFKVRDTGIGIHEEDLKTIFDKFQQVDKKANRGIEGTGLGLSISKQLVQLMGGDIEVASEYGKGTTFTIRIRQKVIDAQKLSTYVLTQVPEESGSRIRFYAPNAKILVVDDNVVNLRIFGGLLRHYQIEADLADSGEMAVDMAGTRHYDLIFMDHMMPGIDGVEAQRRIRKLDPFYQDSPIIAVSANAIRGVRDKYLEYGFTDFLSKPIEVTHLEQSIKSHLAKDMIIEEVEAEKEPLPEIDFEIKGVDVFSGLLKCDNDLSDYFDILSIFYECGPAKMQELHDLAENDDIAAYAISVHALKSVAANIGAHKLFTMAKIHELAAKNGQAAFVKGNVESLLELYDTILRNIGAILSEKGYLS